MAVFLGWLLAGEEMSWQIGLGASIIIGSVFLVISAQSRKSSIEEPETQPNPRVAVDIKEPGLALEK